MPLLALALGLATLAMPRASTAQSLPGAGFRADPHLDDPVVAIAQGPDGRVWLGTPDGLFAYDGYEVERFAGGDGDVVPFPRGSVRALFVDRRNRLWVGHGLGLVLVDPIRDEVDGFWVHDPEDTRSLTIGDVTAVHEDRAGRIWVGTLSWADETWGGLNRMDESLDGFERFVHDPRDPGSLGHNRVRTILEDDHGDLWIGTWGGLSRRPAGEDGFVRYRHDAADPTSLAYDDVMRLHQAADGTIWIATIGGGLDRYDRERDAFLHVENPGSDLLMALVEDPGGRLWVGTLDGGLLALEPGSDTLRPVDRGPEAGDSELIATLGITRDRTLWVAGLASEYGGGRMLRLDLDAPRITVRPIGPVFAITEGRDGTTWAASGSRLYRYDPGADLPRIYDCPATGPPNPQQWLSAIGEAPDGSIWASYWDPDHGLCRLDRGSDDLRPVRPSDPDAPRPVWIRDLAWWEGRVWMTAGGSLLALDPVSGAVNVVDAPPDDPVTRAWESIVHLAVDDDGALWYATNDGRLRRLRPGRSEPDRFDRVFPAGDADDAVVSSLAVGADGRLWLGTVSHGVCGFDPAEARCIDSFDGSTGLPFAGVAAVLPDARGRLWLAGGGTILELDPATGEHRALPLPPAVRAGRFQGGNTLGPGGTAYFGSSIGVVAFRPDLSSGNPHPPVTRITRVETVGGGDVELRDDDGESLELPDERSDIVFEYVGHHYVDPPANRYAYRLDGLDDGWRQVGAERRARYTNLAPGPYTFRVRAASPNGVWSEEATFAFRILPPWWRQSWALALWALLAATGAWGLRMVVRRRRAVAAAIEREQREAARLRELSDTRSRLFANLSHEYRTPLSLILGEIETARGTTDGVAADRLENAERQTRELQRLTDELLELSKLEAGAVVLDRRHGDLGDLVRGCVAAFRSAAESGGITLRLDAPDTPVLVNLDPDRLARVVNNLLSNALKFSASGDEVRVEVTTEADVVRLVVEDTGIGIPPDARERIFDRFFRVAGERDPVAGTGIGLALVRELVELHDGTIDVESEVGRGTRFAVRLPLAPETGEEPAAIRRMLTEPDGADASEGELILVVDDHADMRAFLRRELSTEPSYRVEEAADGASGLARAIELVPDLLITDLAMPGTDGFELVRRLREDERTCHVPIIMLTGRASDEARIEGLESGVDEYLTKPFSPRLLRSRVANLLELRRLLRNRFAGDVWLRPAEVEATSTDRKFLDRVSRVIEERMADSAFSVEELARDVAMSRSQLHRKLTAVLGQPPGPLIRRMRLQRAADLIRSGSRTLGQIAYDTGFSDQAHFSRSFKKEFGCTPSEFRADLAGRAEAPD